MTDLSRPPKIASDAQGDLLLEASDVARRFNIPVDEFRRRAAAGLVVSRIEVGNGEDQGRRRISIRSGNRLWRAILDADGRIETERMMFIRLPSSARGGGQ